MYPVSIIIVTHFSRHEIAACLHSICEQTGVAFELIIWDNASKDETCKEIERFLKSSSLPIPNITLVRNSEHQDFSLAINQAIKLAKGNYVLPLKTNELFKDSSELANLVAHTEQLTIKPVITEFMKNGPVSAKKPNIMMRLLSVFCSTTPQKTLYIRN